MKAKTKFGGGKMKKFGGAGKMMRGARKGMGGRKMFGGMGKRGKGMKIGKRKQEQVSFPDDAWNTDQLPVY